MLDLHASKAVRRIDIKYGKNAWVSVFIHKDLVLQVRPNGNHFARALNDIVIAAKGIPDIGLDEQPDPIMAPRRETPSRPSSMAGRSAMASTGQPPVGASGPIVLSSSSGAVQKASKAVEQPKEVAQEGDIKELVKPKSIVVTKIDAGRTAAVATERGAKQVDAKKGKEKKKYDTYRQLLKSLAATLKLEDEPEDVGNDSGDDN